MENSPLFSRFSTQKRDILALKKRVMTYAELPKIKARMSISIYQVQNVLRTYQNLLKPLPKTPEVREGTLSLNDTSLKDRVTISEASRRKLSELHQKIKREEGPATQKGSDEEERFAQQ